MRRLPLLAVASAATALVLAACSGSPAPDPSSPSDAASGGSTASDGTDAPAQAGGTLADASGDAEPTCLDPHVGGNYPQALISTQYLEPLVGRAADGTTTPWLATEWTVSEDGLTWDFTLAERTFTDGTPFDAAAVKANIEHLQDPDTGSSTGYLAVEKVTEVEVVDDRHARFHLSEPDAALLESLAQQWTAMQSPTGLARGMEENCLAPAGTGPFVVTGWTPQQQVDLVANPDYVDATGEAAPPLLDGITWRFVPDAATRYAALVSGEVDVIDNPQPDTITAAEADASLGIEHIDNPRPGSVNRIELNSGQTPFDDIRVREAFIRSANPGPGIEALFSSTAVPSFSPLSSVEPVAVSREEQFTYDLDAANTLLDEAGWTERDADGYRTKDGARLSVRFPVSTNQSVPAEQALFQQIQANVKEAGFEVVLTPLDLGAWYAALGAHEYEAVSAPYTKVGPDVLRILYHSSGTEPAPSGYFANHAYVRDAELDALLDEASATQDAAQRADLLEQAQVRILEGYYILPLYDQQNHFLVRGVTGIDTSNPVATLSFQTASLTD